MPNIADTSFPKLNQEGKIIGFGVVNNTTMVKPSPNPTLKTVYLTVSNCSSHFPGTDTVRNFCGHDDNTGATNLCRGDLGSAFVVTVRGRKVLVCVKIHNFFPISTLQFAFISRLESHQSFRRCASRTNQSRSLEPRATSHGLRLSPVVQNCFEERYKNVISKLL